MGDARGSGERGATIRFAIRESALGPVLVGASDAGLCAVLLGRTPADLRGELEERFAGAAIVAGDAPLDALAARVVAFVEAPGPRGLGVPLDLRGTPFQRLVWSALCEIPPGSTATYTDVAERIGRPRSVRAVAAACAANALAVVVPCHRVVRRDGGLAGYRWGIATKRALLEREARA